MCVTNKTEDVDNKDNNIPLHIESLKANQGVSIHSYKGFPSVLQRRNYEYVHHFPNMRKYLRATTHE